MYVIDVEQSQLLLLTVEFETLLSLCFEQKNMKTAILLLIEVQIANDLVSQMEIIFSSSKMAEVILS